MGYNRGTRTPPTLALPRKGGGLKIELPVPFPPQMGGAQIEFPSLPLDGGGQGWG